MEELDVIAELLDRTKNGELFIQDEEEMEETLLEEIIMLFWRVDMENICIVLLVAIFMLKRKVLQNM